jgi:hypothetical protein
MSGNVLSKEEEKAALSGEAIPMYEKYLGPKRSRNKKKSMAQCC